MEKCTNCSNRIRDVHTDRRPDRRSANFVDGFRSFVGNLFRMLANGTIFYLYLYPEYIVPVIFMCGVVIIVLLLNRRYMHLSSSKKQKQNSRGYYQFNSLLEFFYFFQIFPGYGNIFTNERFISLLFIIIIIVTQKLNLWTLGIFSVLQTNYAFIGLIT